MLMRKCNRASMWREKLVYSWYNFGFSIRRSEQMLFVPSEWCLDFYLSTKYLIDSALEKI